MSVSAIFKSNLPYFQYLFKDGVAAIFIEGRYQTSDEQRIRELATEVGDVGKYKSKHPYIFVDEDEQEVDSEALTPLELIKLQAKEEARKELLEEQKLAADMVANNTSFSSAVSFANSLNTTEKQTIAVDSAEKKVAPITVPAPVPVPVPATDTSSIKAKLANFNLQKP